MPSNLSEVVANGSLNWIGEADRIYAVPAAIESDWLVTLSTMASNLAATRIGSDIESGQAYPSGTSITRRKIRRTMRDYLDAQ